MRIAIMIQARMESSRFPGKVMADCAGKPMLQRVIDRCRGSKYVDKTTADAYRGVLMLSMPINKENEPIAVLAYHNQIGYWRQWPRNGGSSNEVTFSYVEFAAMHAVDLVVRITADCPLVDPAIIDKVIESWHPGVDYVSNLLHRTYPRGMDVCAFTPAAIMRSYKSIRYEPDYEHVSLNLRAHRRKYITRSVEDDEDNRDLNVSVDTPEQLALVSRIYNDLGADVGYKAIIRYLRPATGEIHA